MSATLSFSRGDIIANKYEVIDCIDEGPLGVSYRCKHEKTGKYVRLMMLHPSVVARNQKEELMSGFRLAKEIDHPNLVRLGELGEHEGQAYYTFEDFESCTLRELLQEYRIKGKQFALKEAAQISIQILEGLAALHEHGLVFRALRPEYVLIQVKWSGPRQQTFVAQAKIVGAGLWNLVPSAALAEDEFTNGEAQFLAPELKGFEPQASPRCDVYSAGIVLYELLVGAPPVGTFQPPKTRRPDLPAHVNDVVELALAPAPEDRYPAAHDFIRDLQRTFEDAAFSQDQEKQPLISPLGWGIALATVALAAFVLFNFRPDPALQAQVADGELRASVFAELQQTAPSPEAFRKVYARHPANMVYIPPGPFIAGRMNAEADVHRSEPLAETRRTAGYLIDQFEYPNVKGERPVFDVTQLEAQQMCEDDGKRLCSADEWERACKGRDSHVYAYGDVHDPEFCGEGVEDPYPAGSYGECHSDWGVFDQSGSFREWTSTETKPGRAVVKGGLRSQPEKGTRCATAIAESASFADKSIGFRCCRDVNAPPVSEGTTADASP